MKSRSIFIAVHGQDDNLGDSVLRRAMVDAARRSGLRLHVLIGQNGVGYCSALGLCESDVIYRSRAEWSRALAVAAIGGRAHVISNAGEIQLNRRRIKILLSEIALLSLVALRGGQRLATGLGIRQASGPRVALLRLWARMFGLVSWRDSPSRELAGGRGVVSPDWSLALGTAVSSWLPSHERTTVVLSFRGDRPSPPNETLEQIREVCQGSGLKLVVVTQVARDAERNESVAQLLDARHLRPDSNRFDHSTWESQVRDLYRTTRFAFSDRLHVLMIAATEGCVPVGPGEDPKIHRTFEAAGLTLRQIGARDRGVNTEFDALVVQIQRARDELAGLSGKMVERMAVPSDLVPREAPS